MMKRRDFLKNSVFAPIVGLLAGKGNSSPKPLIKYDKTIRILIDGDRITASEGVLWETGPMEWWSRSGWWYGSHSIDPLGKKHFLRYGSAVLVQNCKGYRYITFKTNEGFAEDIVDLIHLRSTGTVNESAYTFDEDELIKALGDIEETESASNYGFDNGVSGPAELSEAKDVKLWNNFCTSAGYPLTLSKKEGGKSCLTG